MKPIQEQVLQSKGLEQQPLIERLRTRAAIRRSIKNRKSVQEGKPDRIADLLDEAADEVTGLQTANLELIEVLKANQIAEAMTTYGDSSDFVWPKSEMRKPGDTAWGWICEKHGLGYQSGCICCSGEFDEYRKRKDQTARYLRDEALREASKMARKALEKHGGK